MAIFAYGKDQTLPENSFVHKSLHFFDNDLRTERSDGLNYWTNQIIFHPFQVFPKVDHFGIIVVQDQSILCNNSEMKEYFCLLSVNIYSETVLFSKSGVRNVETRWDSLNNGDQSQLWREIMHIYANQYLDHEQQK